MTTNLPKQKFYRVRTVAVETEARKPADTLSRENEKSQA